MLIFNVLRKFFKVEVSRSEFTKMFLLDPNHGIRKKYIFTLVSVEFRGYSFSEKETPNVCFMCTQITTKLAAGADSFEPTLWGRLRGLYCKARSGRKTVAHKVEVVVQVSWV